MTIYKAYLVALRATVTLTYIPVMTPGLYDTFPGHIGPFPGLLLMEILIFNHRLVQWSGCKISIFSSKNGPGNVLICPGNVPGGPGNVS